MRVLDVNCDLGESFGVYEYGADPAMLPLITSANVACGGHAGDPPTMRASVEQPIAHGVAIGAHVGLPDRWGFGRREIPASGQELYDLVLAQMGALEAAEIGTPGGAAERTAAALTDPAFAAAGGIDSVCVHSDTPDAPSYLTAVLSRLHAIAGVTIRSPQPDTGSRYARASY